MFQSLDHFQSELGTLPPPNRLVAVAARARQSELTKPPGALGLLEECAITIAAWQDNDRPCIERPATIVFAGNHGVTAQGVSPYPADVTAQMVANFEAGGAAINAITRTIGTELTVVPIELERPTNDITSAPAMSDEDLLTALNIGAEAISKGTDLLALGEMGIGNTTIAAALSASSFGGSGADWAGPGTGLDETGMARKANVIDDALARHSAATSATERLRCLGGREVAALAGAILAARKARIPVLLDGFVVSSAIAPLFADNPAITDHCFAGHVSAEPAHRRLLKHLNLRPLLDLDMRLGEATGATLAVAVLQAAVAAHSQMATFAEAAVSGKEQA